MCIRDSARHFPVCSYVMLVKDKKFILKALGIITEPGAAAGAAATAVAAENGQSTDSVSYTHLDVYKRQEVDCYSPKSNTVSTN